MDFATMEEQAPLQQPTVRKPYGAYVALTALFALGATSALSSPRSPALLASSSGGRVRVAAYADAL